MLSTTEKLSKVNQFHLRDEIDFLSHIPNDSSKIIIESIPQIVWTCSADGIWDYCNLQWFEFTRIPNKKVYSKKGWLAVVHPGDLEKTWSLWEKSLKTGQAFEIEHRLRDGRSRNYCCYLTRAVPVKSPRGQVLKWFGTSTNMDHYQFNEEKFRQYVIAIDTIEEAIITKDLDGTISSWNPGAERMFGYFEKEIVGKNIRILFPDEKLDEFDEIIEILKMGESIDHLETIRRKKSGQIIDVLISVSPIKDVGEEVIGAAIITRDVSQIKELSRRQESFIGMASHELKTPITTMKAYTQISKRLVKDQRFDLLGDFLNKIDDQTYRLAELVNDLLDLSKIQSGKLELQKTKYDLISQIKDVVENLKELYPSRDIQIEDAPSRLGICGDKNRIEQVIINLITNAVKYSLPDKPVLVSVRTELNKVTVGVEDLGIGISKHNLDKVFDRFFREEGDSEKTYPGLGIGLFVSSEIIKRHGGQIWTKSQKNEGSTFYFALPLK